MVNDFIKKCAAGVEKAGNLDKYVKKYEKEGYCKGVKLWCFLGMTKEEADMWYANDQSDEALDAIIRGRAPKLRVCWYPTLGLGEPFIIPVKDIFEADRVRTILSYYDQYEIENGVKRDDGSVNFGTIEMFDKETDEWVPWEYEDDDVYLAGEESDLVVNIAKLRDEPELAEEHVEFAKAVAKNVSWGANV